MSLMRQKGNWVMAFAAVACLAFAAGVLVQRPAMLGIATAREPHASEGVASANELSQAFRQAAKEVLPGMVSIVTRGKAMAMRGEDGNGNLDEMLENSPFGEMLKNDPRWKELFKNRGPQKMPRPQGMGSGFVIDPSGVILTANHVVADAEQVRVKLHDGREYNATEWKTDPKTDVAIVRIKPEGSLTALRLGDSDAVEIGDWVLAIGSPFGLDATVTAGIISAKGRGPGITAREDFLQTDAAINPGNSGGPLVNVRGEVIGINTAISTRSGGYDGVGFAVPINLAHWVSDQLVEKGAVTRAYIGVAIDAVTNALARHYHVPVGKGAIISDVMPDSPAAEAKLEAGDLVVKFNGKEVNGTRDLQTIVERLKINGKYPMQIIRDGKEMTVQIQLREMPANFAMAGETVVPDHGKPEAPKAEGFSDLGLSVESVTPEALKNLGYRNEVNGVLISSVKEDSPAAEAGLREGLVIEKVGPKRVTSPAEFKEALKDQSLEKGILMIVRNPRTAKPILVQKES